MGLCLLRPVSKFFQLRAVRIAAGNPQLSVSKSSASSVLVHAISLPKLCLFYLQEDAVVASWVVGDMVSVLTCL